MENEEGKIRVAADVAAHHDVFSFMLAALRESLTPSGTHPTPHETRLVLRLAAQQFRGEHLTLPPTLPVPPELAGLAHTTYRESLEALMVLVTAMLDEPSE